jgi:hypothetical protein
MKRFFTVVLAMLAGIPLSLLSVLALFEATLRIELMENLLLRASAILAALVLGVLLLVGSVFFYVRLAVFLFGNSQPRT